MWPPSDCCRSATCAAAGPIAEQLQAALNSRIIIEQAKGKLAERFNLAMDQAFALLRDHARTTNRRLSDLARAFIDGTEPLTAPGPGHNPRSSGRARGATGGR